MSRVDQTKQKGKKSMNLLSRPVESQESAPSQKGKYNQKKYVIKEYVEKK